MTTFYNLEESQLSNIYGGTPAGAAVPGALTCAAGGVKFGVRFGLWGAVIGGLGGAAVCGYLAYKASGG